MRGALPLGDVNLMVNLANDAIGYIIPKSEWDNEAPWIYGATEETYGEIVSVSRSKILNWRRPTTIGICIDLDAPSNS